MKIQILLPIAAVSLALALADRGSAAEAELQILQRSAHEQVWGSVQTQRLPSGEEILVTNELYRTVATGLCYQDPSTGQWADSQELFRPVPGGAIADMGQHKLLVPKDLADGPMQIKMPDGRGFSAFPRFLAYADSSGKSVLVGEIRQSEGKIIAPNVVFYSNICPDDVRGVGLRVSYYLWGYEADVVFSEEFPPAPEDCGLSPDSSLQMWTEVSPELAPTVSPSVVESAAGEIPDENISFTTMNIGAGKAFSLNRQDAKGDLPVAKEYARIERADGAKHFLIERVRAKDFFKLAALPRAEGASISKPMERNKFVASLLSGTGTRHAKRSGSSGMEFAMGAAPTSGAILDYVTLNSTQSNYVFAASSTYYIVNVVNLNSVTTFEPGTVLKFTNSPSVKLVLNGPLVSSAGPHAMVLLTCRNDDSVGGKITGSTGVPSSTNAATYIEAAAGQTNAYKWMRFSYAGTALKGPNMTNGVWHCQFVSCGRAVESTANNPLPLRNVLIAQCTNGVVTTGPFSGEHLTVDQCSTLLSGTGSSGTLTNSVLTAVPTLGYITTTTATAQFSTGNGLYQIAAGGGYYLGGWACNASPDINPILAKDLARLTTYPPLSLPATIGNAGVLWPRAMRDAAVQVPGFHYAPLDFLASNVVLKASLTLTNGVALGLCGTNAFYLQSGANVYSTGLAGQMNVLARVASVQEQPLALRLSTAFNTGRSYPSLGFRFTSVLFGQGGVASLIDAMPGETMFGPFWMRDCLVHCAGISSYSCYPFDETTEAPGSITLTNNVMDSCNITANGYGLNLFTFRLQANLLRKCSVSLYSPCADQYWSIQDNLFDGTSGSCYDAGIYSFYRDHNAFMAGTTDFLGGTGYGNKTNLVADFQSGLLGPYYYPTNGNRFSLANLRNAGSTAASYVGLYHFTTTTNQVKEAWTTLDIGFHYVAVDAQGNPLDSDGDGVPDYIEDTDGGGTQNGSERNWQVSENRTTSQPGLQVFTPLH